jgi:hypothetical protein
MFGEGHMVRLWPAEAALDLANVVFAVEVPA